MVSAALISIAAFVGVLLLILGAIDLYRLSKYGDASKTRQRLKSGASAQAHQDAIDIIRKDAMSDQPFLDMLQEKFSPVGNLKVLLLHADSDMPVGLFLIVSGGCALAGVGLGVVLQIGFLMVLMGMVIGGLLPLFFLIQKRNRRYKKLEAQLPDALDLIARTLLAGHAFMMGMKMVGDQLEDPVATEFRKAFDEINFGISVQDAIRGISDRVDTVDVKFFVTSVLVQLETGGNLAEIIQSISRLIRERFELMGKVAALSAEGKISAIIMFALPILVGIALFTINPDYMMLLFTDPLGQNMLQGGFSMMVFGMFVTRRMIQIRV